MKKRRKRPRSVPLECSVAKNWLISGCILTISGAAFFPLALYEYSKASPAASWPTVTGVIEQSRVSTASSSSGTLGVSSSYHPDVVYRYVVNGQEHLGRNVHLGIGANTQSAAQATVRRYPVGQQVSVHYAPANPVQSVLDPTVQRRTFTAVFCTGTALGLGLFFLDIFRKVRRKELWG